MREWRNGRRTWFRSKRSNPWGFESLLPHQISVISNQPRKRFDEPQNPNQSQDKQPQLKLTNTADYRDGYANSVQVRMSVWDFFLVFGTMSQDSAEELNVEELPGHLPQPAAGQGPVECARPQPRPVRADLWFHHARASSRQSEGPVN